MSEKNNNTKIRCTYTIDKRLAERLERVCNTMKISKSSFINNTLDEHLEAYETLFPKGLAGGHFSLQETFAYMANKFKMIEDRLKEENEDNEYM